MYSKLCDKICICSVILGELKSLRNCKGFSIIFPKILVAIQRIMKVKIFFNPLHHIFESENFRFPLSYEK